MAELTFLVSSSGKLNGDNSIIPLVFANIILFVTLDSLRISSSFGISVNFEFTKTLDEDLAACLS